MSKLEEDARRVFELRMETGVRRIMYPLVRFAGGEYVSKHTEIAWQEFKAGWEAAYGKLLTRSMHQDGNKRIH